MNNFTLEQADELYKVLESFCDCSSAIDHIGQDLEGLGSTSNLVMKNLAKESLVSTLNYTKKYLLDVDNTNVSYSDIGVDFNEGELVEIARLRWKKFTIKVEKLRIRLRNDFSIEIAG